MSTLFHISIELVAGPTVWARFEVCHPDQWDVPRSKDFALLVVVEIYDDMKRGFEFGSHHQPISRDEAGRVVATHSQREKVEHWLELYSGMTAKPLQSKPTRQFLMLNWFAKMAIRGKQREIQIRERHWNSQRGTQPYLITS